MIFEYDFPEDDFLAYEAAVRQVQTTRQGGREAVAESITRSRYSQRATELGEVVLTVDLSVESVSIEVPSAGLAPSEVAGFPRGGRLRMERNGRILEMPPDMPVGRGLVFPETDLNPGDTWRVREDLAGGVALVEHMFVGWDQWDGREVALLMSRSLEYRAEAGGQVLDGALEGETLFDPEEGCVVRSLMSVTTRIRVGEDEQLTQISSQVDRVPHEALAEASSRAW